MNKEEKLIFEDFNAGQPLIDISGNNQGKYLASYLKGLGCKSVLIEPNYFDRDYLSEHAVYYSQSALGYPNSCKRYHFFSEIVSREALEAALTEDKASIAKMQGSYLGFCIVRPIDQNPFGRTVLVWYKDRTPDVPRIDEPSRLYTCNLAGLRLSVRGLAWQQQDQGVAACATVAIWSMLQSSAFDDFSSIPTTTEITESACDSVSVGRHAFPAHKGLRLEQVTGAIIKLGLRPQQFNSNLEGQPLGYDLGRVSGIERHRFSSLCGALIRSGYPVLLVGGLYNKQSNNASGKRLVFMGGHAMCAVGLRSAGSEGSSASILETDSNAPTLYINEDNIGPAVRFEVESVDVNDGGCLAALRPKEPSYIGSEESADLKYPDYFIPTAMIVAVHNHIRIDLDELLNIAESYASWTATIFECLKGFEKIKVRYSVRVLPLSSLFREELVNVISDKKILARVRMDLQERVPPMSKFVAVVRLGWKGDGEGINVLNDIVLDTSTLHGHGRVFANIVYENQYDEIVKDVFKRDHSAGDWKAKMKHMYGKKVIAY